MDVRIIKSEIVRIQVTKLLAVPVAPAYLIDAELVRKYNVSTVQRIVVGGGVFGKESAKRMQETWPNASIRTGMIEDSTRSTVL